MSNLSPSQTEIRVIRYVTILWGLTQWWDIFQRYALPYFTLLRERARTRRLVGRIDEFQNAITRRTEAFQQHESRRDPESERLLRQRNRELLEMLERHSEDDDEDPVLERSNREMRQLIGREVTNSHRSRNGG